MVLLKNEDGFLPLDKNIAPSPSSAPIADDLMTVLGNYCGTPSRATTVLEGSARPALAPDAHGLRAAAVTSPRGCRRCSPSPPPTCARRTADPGETGLAAAYYDNAAIAGVPVLQRVDPLVNFAWKGVIAAQRRAWAIPSPCTGPGPGPAGQRRLPPRRQGL